MAQAATGHTIVVEKSTLPVRTAAAIKTILEAASDGEEQRTFSVLSNPEFLAEGTAIRDLESPDRVLIGGDDPASMMPSPRSTPTGCRNSRFCAPISGAELAGLTANAFLAQRISSINSIAAFCEASGQMREARMIGTDSRSARNSSMQALASEAVVSRKTSTWCVCAAISACRRWRITGKCGVSQHLATASHCPIGGGKALRHGDWQATGGAGLCQSRHQRHLRSAGDPHLLIFWRSWPSMIPRWRPTDGPGSSAGGRTPG